jgi:hypothetical protein
MFEEKALNSKLSLTQIMGCMGMQGTENDFV